MTPVKHNLVALGSAAVLAVYAAGYSRTRAAAAEFATESENRRPRAPLPVHAAPVEAAPKSQAATTPTHTAPTTPPPQHASVRTHAASKAAKHTDSASSKPAADTVASSVAPIVVPAPDSTKTASAQTTDSTAKTSGYKDGTYSGWGTSRHGDIEATVLIKDGRIAAAIISQCLTQYSCSLIAELPVQVALRQSPEVDFVSGATQSTNAFYYAVVNALKKAK